MQKFARLSALAYYNENKKAGFVKTVFSPAVRFARDYFFNGGVFYGKTGYKICKYNAFYTKMKYVNLRNLYNEPYPLTLREFQGIEVHSLYFRFQQLSFPKHSLWCFPLDS